MSIEQYVPLAALFGLLCLLIARLFRIDWYNPVSVLVSELPADYYKGKGGGRDETGGLSMKEVQQAVWERDKGKCYHCGSECYLGKPRNEDLEKRRRKACFSHRIANAHGGEEVPGNLEVACYDCNAMMASDIILQPAIDFAANQHKTICTEGLVVAEGCETIIEFYQRRVAA